jgi:hypothetical protein
MICFALYEIDPKWSTIRSAGSARNRRMGYYIRRMKKVFYRCNNIGVVHESTNWFWILIILMNTFKKNGSFIRRWLQIKVT